MSRGAGAVLAAVEWSPTHVSTAVPGQPVANGLPSGLSAIRACLSRRNTFVRAIRIPNVSGAEADKILKLQVPQAFPVPPAELVYSYRLTHDISPEGRLVVVSATRADTLRGLHESLRSMGAKVEEVIPAAYGSALLAKSLGLNDTAVIEKSSEGWSIDLVVDGELRYSRVIPVETDLEALESEVCRTFGMAGLPCGSMLAAGGEALAFADVRSERSTLEMLASAEAGALGVRLELPEVVAAREKRLLGNRARLASLLWVSAVAMGLLIGSDRMDRADEVRRYQTQFETGSRKLKSTRDAAQLKVNSLSQSSQLLDRAFEPAQKASEVIALVGALAPEGVWLTGITFERGKPTLLRGIATNNNSVAAFQDKLSTHERLREVRLVFSNDSTIEDTKVSQFSISLHVIGNLPLVDPKSKSRTASR